ncbi:hypothetical protein BH11PAT2_BH11PAT2_08770 [soil metagenome]
MNIFKSTNFTWWQLGLLKWAVLFIGIAIGATWPEVFAPYASLLVVVGLVISLYLVIVWYRNK